MSYKVIKLILLKICLCSWGILSAQVKIFDPSITSPDRTPHASAMLELESNTRGFLPPRISLTGNLMLLNAVTPANGTLVYNTNTASVSGFSGVGLYIWHDAKWNMVLDRTVQTADIAANAVTIDKIAPGAANQVLVTNPAGTSAQWTNGLSNRLVINGNTTLTDTHLPIGGSLVLVFNGNYTVTAMSGAAFSPVVSTSTTISSSAGTYFLTRNSSGTIDIAASPLLSSVSHVEVGNYKFSAAGSLNGYLLCDGSNISRTTYSALFNVIGTSFGTGDGSTTFTLPDFRGRVFGGISPVAAGAVSVRPIGTKVGAETHTLTVAQMPSHFHYLYNPYESTINGGAYPGFMYNDYSNNTAVPTKGQSSPTGGNAAHNIMQPTLFGGNVFIKY